MKDRCLSLATILAPITDIQMLIHKISYYHLLALALLFTILFSCGDSPNPKYFINLPADGPVLMIGEGENNPLEVVKQALGKNPLMAKYRMLEEDSLFNYGNLVLLEPNLDSLTAHRRTSIERFVAAGGRLLVVDDRPAVPYAWAWYNEHLANAKEVKADGNEQVLVVSGASAAAQTFFASPTSPAPAAAATLPLSAPKEDRFQLEVLDDQIYEPMEMEVLPNGSVLFLERRGKMKLSVKGKTRLVHDFDVCIEGNYEDGLHGIALDPGFDKDNDWIYLYYTPSPCDSLDQVLSRFEFKNGILDTSSEITVLRVTVQRDKCCHSGGGLEFGPDGLLYLSTGDNTSSKESDGYSPIDERPGRGPFDAQKSSGNTNDLRGKILRIRPTPKGGYEIPEGNLFPNGEGGRPEIYVMGARNPFRISIDPWSNFLYWGDVGPDVGQAGRYGPESFDEWNQAPTAGNYGWPYFVGDNYAYPDRDFASDEVGPLYDAKAPVNESPNNTGARVLPPARPALIWYPYGNSKEFPMLGSGSRSSMSGPFYDKDNLVPITNSALPDYYHGKWFIYEWARSWIKGSNGVWGESLMSAHPTLSTADAETMVGYILSLDNSGRLPMAGKVSPGPGSGTYVLAASYRDGGGRSTPPLVGQQALIFRPTRLEVETENDGLYRAAVPGSGVYQGFAKVSFRPGGWMRLANIHLKDIRRLVVRLQAKEVGELSLHYGSPDGEVLASATVSKTTKWDAYDALPLNLPSSVDGLPPGDLYLVWKGEDGIATDDMGHHRPGDLGWIDAIEVKGISR
jgi:cytochrome c